MMVRGTSLVPRYLMPTLAAFAALLLASCDDSKSAANASVAIEKPANAALAPPEPIDMPDNAQALNTSNASEPAPPPLPEPSDKPPPRRAMTDPVEPAEATEDGAAPVRPFPDQVTRFMVQRDGCDHFLGEEPYDDERRAYLDQSVRELCTGTDRKLKRLRKIYADNPDVIAALKNYEDVETAPPQE